MTIPICPRCGSPAAIIQTRHGPRAAHCGLWSWGGKPLADAETHAARQAAHAVFDPLWQSPGRTLSRTQAYRRLSDAMGLPAARCHIALMTAAEAARVVAVVQSGVLEASP